VGQRGKKLVFVAIGVAPLLHDWQWFL